MKLELGHTGTKVFYTFDSDYYSKINRWSKMDAENLKAALADIAEEIFPLVKDGFIGVFEPGQAPLLKRIQFVYDDSLKPGVSINDNTIRIYIPVQCHLSPSSIRKSHSTDDISGNYSTSGKYPFYNNVLIDYFKKDGLFDVYKKTIDEFSVRFSKSAGTNLRLPARYRTIIC